MDNKEFTDYLLVTNKIPNNADIRTDIELISTSQVEIDKYFKKFMKTSIPFNTWWKILIYTSYTKYQDRFDRVCEFTLKINEEFLLDAWEWRSIRRDILECTHKQNYEKDLEKIYKKCCLSKRRRI